MKARILILLCLGSVLMLSGCGLWEGAPFQRENIETPSPSYSELSAEPQE